MNNNDFSGWTPEGVELNPLQRQGQAMPPGQVPTVQPQLINPYQNVGLQSGFAEPQVQAPQMAGLVQGQDFGVQPDIVPLQQGAGLQPVLTQPQTQLQSVQRIQPVDGFGGSVELAELAQRAAAVQTEQVHEYPSIQQLAEEQGNPGGFGYAQGGLAEPQVQPFAQPVYEQAAYDGQLYGQQGLQQAGVQPDFQPIYGQPSPQEAGGVQGQFSLSPEMTGQQLWAGQSVSAQNPPEAEAKATRREKDIKTIKKFLIKLAVVAAVGYAVFAFVYGVAIASGESMFPRVRDGDLFVYYRLDKDYSIGEVVAYERGGKLCVGRVVAKGGDVVDISEFGGFKVNESVQDEEIYYQTLPIEGGIEYPYTVPSGSYFILCDFRTNGNDSRTFGAVEGSDIKGKLISILRRRGI